MIQVNECFVVELGNEHLSLCVRMLTYVVAGDRTTLKDTRTQFLPLPYHMTGNAVVDVT